MGGLRVKLKAVHGGGAPSLLDHCRTGQRLFKVAPIHHHFHIIGWTEQQVVTRFWIVTALLVVLAIALIKVR